MRLGILLSAMQVALGKRFSPRKLEPTIEKSTVSKSVPMELALQIYAQQSENLRSYRRDQVETLTKFTTLVVTIFAATFLVHIDSGPPGYTGIVVSIRLYTLIFGLAVPAFILVGWLIWLDLVIVQEVALNRREMLRFQVDSILWPDSVRISRSKKQLHSPRALYGKLAGLLMFSGAALGAPGLFALRMIEASTWGWLQSACVAFCAVFACFGFYVSFLIYRGLKRNRDELGRLNREEARRIEHDEQNKPDQPKMEA